MWVKAVLVMTVAMVVMQASSYPHQQAQTGSEKVDSVVSESLQELRRAILESAINVANVIEETIQKRVDEAMQEQGVATGSIAPAKTSGDAVHSDFNKKAIYGSVLSKISARSASAKKTVVDPKPRSSKDATTTTTLDPMDEYCKEACEAGVGGPECDCPDHPIG